LFNIALTLIAKTLRFSSTQNCYLALVGLLSRENIRFASPKTKRYILMLNCLFVQSMHIIVRFDFIYL